MIGICLQGGGAKGAFEAGVIYGLLEKGIDFDIITGTSIGAINGYYLYSRNGKKLRKLWTEFKDKNFYTKIYMKNVVENILLVSRLRFLRFKKSQKELYVNYVSINENKLEEKIVNVHNLSYREGLKAIRYSSLLPYRVNKFISISEIYENFDTKIAFDNFREDVSLGIYNGYNLDGGILNNDLIEPFLKNKVNKLFIIALFNKYEVNEDLLKIYNKEDIIVIKPDFDGNISDTLNFTNEFCKTLFWNGYEKVKKINVDIF